MKNTRTLALACALCLALCAGSARAEIGYVEITQKNLGEAERHDVVLKITKDERDLFALDICITPLNQRDTYNLELVIDGRTRIQLEKRMSKAGKIFSRHWLSREVMANSRLGIWGVAGHEFTAPDNLLNVDLKSFLEKD